MTLDGTWYEFTQKLNDPAFRAEVQREAERALKLEEERRRAVQPGFKGILGDTKTADELFKAGIPAGDNERQPMPTPQTLGEPDVWAQIIAEMEKRRRVGIKRYKTALQPFNSRDALRDLFEELLDALAYTQQTMLETAKIRLYLMVTANRLEEIYNGVIPIGRAGYFNALKEIATNLRRIVNNEPIIEESSEE